MIKSTHKLWNLEVNDSKTEFVEFYLASKNDLNKNGENLIDNEPWQRSKQLESFICCERDISHSIILANSAFQKYQKLWSKKKISMKLRIDLYTALVKSVLVYNCNRWALQNVLWKNLMLTIVLIYETY